MGQGGRIFRRIYHAKEKYERASCIYFAEIILPVPFPLMDIYYIALIYLILVFF